MIEPRITAEVFEVLSVERSVASRTSFGGTAPARVRAAIQAAKERYLWLGHTCAAICDAFLLGGCSLGGRVHLGDIWLEAGHGLALVGNHVALAID